MSKRRTSTQYRVVAASIGILLSVWSSFAQATPSQSKPQLFQAYFEALAAEPHIPQRRDPHGPNREHLIEIIPTMTTAELQQVVPFIDGAIDRARATHDGIERMWAGTFLYRIATTKDGPALLAPDVSRLSELCRDPFTLTGSVLMFPFLRSRYPELRVPEMLRAIQTSDANSPGKKDLRTPPFSFFNPNTMVFCGAFSFTCNDRISRVRVCSTS